MTLGLAAFAVAEGVHAAPEKLGGFSEVVLGPTPETVMAIVSPDGRHAAYAAPSGAKNAASSTCAAARSAVVLMESKRAFTSAR